MAMKGSPQTIPIITIRYGNRVIRQEWMCKEMKSVKKYTTIVVGVMMVAFAISVFYTPNKIVSGGVSGIATILFHTVGIPTSISFTVINGVLLLLALKYLGFSFVKGTVFGRALISVFVELFSHVPPLTDDLFLASIFGSVLYGIGIGLTLMEGASTGGTDILGRLVQKMIPYVKIGSLLLAVDAIVIFLSLLTFRQVDLALYGIIALFFSSFSINVLISKLNVSKLAFVVSDDGVNIARDLVSRSPRGVTIIDATGAYSMGQKKVLMCALKENEIPDFQAEVLSLDQNAFIIYSESQQIVGKGFRVYR